MSDSQTPVRDVEQLLEYFRGSETQLADWRIGTEHEKVGIYTDSFERVSYEGERGIGALLERIAKSEDWTPVYEEGKIIALRREGASITLEPGGQIELSGAPLWTIRETCREFNTHVDLVKDLSEDMGIAWLGLGADPLHSVPEIPRMPKGRYEIMRNYLPTRGSLALEMMFATATVQANFDYADEADMASKMRTAMGCTAIVSAIFANSSLKSGSASGYTTRRLDIWRDTDPDRCGLLHFVFEEGFGYREYAEWALDVPMFFIHRDDSYLPLGSTSFRQFMNSGFEGHRATLEDWDMHLTTVFPEVRLKKIIEVRGADTASRALICALPAIWKGLLYDAEACEAAWGLVAGWSREQREEAQQEVALHGLKAQVGSRPVLELANELVDISASGLARIAKRGETDADERNFLEPVREQLALGQSPGETVLEKWQGEWQASAERLIEYARY